jgi:uncharacterized protein (DUF362 family)
MRRELTRRELALLFGAGALAGAAGRQPSVPVVNPGVVGLAECEAHAKGSVSRETAHRAIGGALSAAVGASSGVESARALFVPSDTVGIKVNCLAGRALSPRVELVEALVELIAEAGVDRKRIIVFERSSRELEKAGYTIRRSGPPYRCLGTDNDYEDQPSSSGAIGSCFARFVSTTCTALVSFGVVKDHDLAGVSAGMKNWYGVIHNPNKYHDSGCDPYVADVARHPFIRDKFRVTVLDGVVAQCHGGPAYRAGATFPLGVVAASTDQVAADLWAWQVIEKERLRRGMPTLEEAGRPVRFLATAARHGLGVDDPEQLRLVSA